MLSFLYRGVIGLLVVLCLTPIISAQQPELGECTERPTVIQDRLYVDNIMWCVESVVFAPDIEPMSFTALEVAPDGTLYATRPLSGQVMAIVDTNDDFFPDTMETYATDLTLPNGLAYHDDALYVSGGANIYRIDPDRTVTTIVDDLPAGAGFWTGGIAISDENRLYVTIGAPCDGCEFEEADRGVILSMNLDGSDREIYASGFRQPADVEFYRGELWSVDTSPRTLVDRAYDEINVIEAGGFYGYPYCIGNNETYIESDTVDCDTAIPPRVAFGTSATPTSLAAYPYDVMPGTADTLIAVLSGEPTQIDFNGYKVIMIEFRPDNTPRGVTLLMPYRKDSGKWAYEPYPDDGYRARHIISLSEQGWGIYPDQPLAVAVNTRGWIYISMTGGQIVAMRPVHELPDRIDIYPIWAPMNPNYEPAD